MKKANTHLTVALLAGILGHFGQTDIKVIAVALVGLFWIITFFVSLFDEE